MKVTMLCPSRPAGNIELDLQKDDKQQWKINNKYKLKEGSINALQLTFKVHHDIVVGLKLHTIVKKGPMTLNKDEEVIGSFSPVKEAHVF